MPGALCSLAFLGLHGGVHLWDALRHAPSAGHAGLVDLLGVFGPVLLIAIVLIPFAPRRAMGRVGP